jgi:bifunctional non-homologous end joining protein LigD
MNSSAVQLANLADPADLRGLFANDGWVMQKKHDGRRALVSRRQGRLSASGRSGRDLAISATLAARLAALPDCSTLDGELVGDSFHAFDLLELEGRDLREIPLGSRLDLLADVPVVRVESFQEERKKVFQQWRRARSEGVIFKDLASPYRPGRPVRGGSWLKWKFINTASCIVSAHNERKSVGISVLDAGVLVNVGNVSIPGSQSRPDLESVIEVQYLYAFPDTRRLFQPVFLMVRDDITSAACLLSQLKYR